MTAAAPIVAARPDITTALSSCSVNERQAIITVGIAPIDLLGEHLVADETVRHLFAGARRVHATACNAVLALTDHRFVAVSVEPAVISVRLADITSIFAHDRGSMRYLAIDAGPQHHRLSVAATSAERLVSELRRATSTAALGEIRAARSRSSRSG
jgi:hypothetical protein